MADPRLLSSFEVNGPQQVRNTTNDQFQGQGISAQDDLITKILKKMFGNTSYPGIGPQALEAPVAGIVLNAKNVEVIKKALGELKSTTPLEVAARYISAKYPKLSSLATKIVQHPDIPSDYLGTWDNPNKVLNVYNPAEQDLETSIRTVAHELTHAAQFKRTPQLFDDYVMPEVDKVAYSNHPTEVGAEQVSKTAAVSFQQFFEKAFPKLDVNKHITEMPDFVEQVLKPSLKDRQELIYKAMETPNLTPSQIASIKRAEESLTYDKQMLINHMDPNWDPIANNKIPLTVGLSMGILDNKGPLEIPASYGVTKQVNPYLMRYLQDRGFSGTSNIKNMTTSNGVTSGFETPGVTLDPAEVLRNFIYQKGNLYGTTR
jgi:hypothetical protein